MLKTFAKKLIGAGHATAAQFTLPPVVFEIAPGFATGAAIEGSKRKGKWIRKLSLQSLGVTTLDPHLSRNNIVNGDEFNRVAADLVAAVGNGDGRYGMIVPDGAVRVTQISFESLPDDAESTE